MCGAQKVQGNLGKIVRVFGRVLGCMHGRVHVSGVCTEWRFKTHGMDECSARLFMAHGPVVILGSDIRYARLGRAATHGLVAHGLNFMGMIEPCG